MSKENILNQYTRRFSPRTVYAILAAALLLTLFLLLPITLSWRINVPCKVLPAREWLLMKNADGSMMATYSDYQQGRTDSYSAMTIVRGDAFRFDLLPSLKAGDMVRAGEAISKVYSHELSRESSRLSGDLEVAKASLAAIKAGEKQTVAQEAERTLALAKEKAQVVNLQFQRQDSLYQRRLISREAFDLARSTAQMAAIEVAIAEAHLQTVRTGDKPEQIRLIESQIQGLEGEIKALSNQVGALTLVSPFTGIFQTSPNPDTLCTVIDTAQVLLMPISVRHLEEVAAGQSVRLRTSRSAGWIEATVQRVEQQVKVVNGLQVIMVTAEVKAGSRTLPANLVAQGYIETGRLSPVGYLLRWIGQIFP